MVLSIETTIKSNKYLLKYNELISTVLLYFRFPHELLLLVQ